jgi:hypothetical protein
VTQSGGDSRKAHGVAVYLERGVPHALSYLLYEIAHIHAKRTFRAAKRRFLLKAVAEVF